jgi:hypothetical protein
MVNCNVLNDVSKCYYVAEMDEINININIMDEININININCETEMQLTMFTSVAKNFTTVKNYLRNLYSTKQLFCHIAFSVRQFFSDLKPALETVSPCNKRLGD